MKNGLIVVSKNMTNRSESIVEIFDNGTGMSEANIRENYIKIGFNKRVLLKSGIFGTLIGRK